MTDLNPSSVKLLRQELNKIETGIDQLTPSREISISKTAIQETQMFLGKVLGDLGEASPYPKDDSKEIADRTDVATEKFNFDATEHIAMVKEIRAAASEKLKTLEEMYMTAPAAKVSQEKKIFFPIHVVSALTHLMKVRMWLGMELDRSKMLLQQKKL